MKLLVIMWAVNKKQLYYYEIYELNVRLTDYQDIKK